MKSIKKRCVALIIVLTLTTTLIPVSGVSAYVPAPKTPYAVEFIDKCEGQEWFIAEVERLLNIEAKTLDSVASSADLYGIKSLGFANRDIDGKIPEAISELKGLRTLFLSGNRLTGEIPAGLFVLPELFNVDLSNNNYTGAIPSEFGGMPALEILMLGGNSFTGTIPDSILGNTKIKTLDVSGNRLNAAIPADLNNMASLTYLDISDNPWVVGALPDLSGLTDLVALHAWECRLNGVIPDWLYDMTSLQTLDISDNALTGTISADIGNLVALRRLGLGRNQLTGTLPDEFDLLLSLDTVDISGNKLTGTLPDIFANVRIVYAQNNYLTGDVLRDIPGDNNSGNFADGATTAQYRLTADSPVRINRNSPINLYPLLQNAPTAAGLAAKPILPADNFTAEIKNDPDSKVELTSDSTGIYVKALEDVLLSEDVTIEIYITDNIGSDYSKTTIKLTTEALSSPPSGGDQTTIPPEPPPPLVEFHSSYIGGYPDGTFRPNEEITREEVASMIIKALGIEPGEYDTPTYNDVPTDRWSYPAIEEASARGYLEGYPGNEFRPSAPMTRAELAALLVRIAEQLETEEPDEEEDEGNQDEEEQDEEETDEEEPDEEDTTESVSFIDVVLGEWYYPHAMAAAQLGLVGGYPDGTFKPQSPVTRAEAVTMINRLLGRDPEAEPKLAEEESPFPDVTPDHWAYLQIIEASVGHERDFAENSEFGMRNSE